MRRGKRELRNNWIMLHQQIKQMVLCMILAYNSQVRGMLSTLKLSSLTPIGRQQQKKLNQIITYLMELPDCAQFIQPVDWQLELELFDYPVVVKNPMHLEKVQNKLKGREFRTVEEVLDHIQLIWDNCKLYNPEGHYFLIADKMERSFKKMIRNYLPNIQVVVPKPVGANHQIITPTPPIIEKIIPPPPTQKTHSKLVTRTSHTTTYHHPLPPPLANKQATEEMGSHLQRIESQMQQISQSQKNRFHQRLKQVSQQQLSTIIFMIQQSCSEGYKQVGGGRGQLHLDSIDSETFRKLNSKLDDMLESDRINGIKKIKN